MEWQKNGNQYLLVNNNEILVRVSRDAHYKSVFEMDNKLYHYRPKGFWNPTYIVTHKDEEILQLKNSWWGGDGQIEFKDKSQYAVRISSRNGLQLQFLDGDREILLYGSKIENRKMKMTFSVADAIIDAEKLLIMAAIGFITFAPYVAENSGQVEITTLLSI